jgi:oligopeptide/dipeptide ABC transporter ATP-binding protein
MSESETMLQIENLYLNFNVYEGTVKVLDGITLRMKKGEVLGIVGETGCGKSVTFKSVVQLLEDNAVIENGFISFQESQNLLEKSDKDMDEIRGRNISVIFQEPMTALNPTMTIGDQIGEGLLVHFKEDMINKSLERLREENTNLSGLYTKLLETELKNKDSIILKLASRIPIIQRYQKFPKIEAGRESVEILKSVDMPKPEIVATIYPHELSGGMRQRVLIAIALACQPELIIADEPTTAVDVTTQAKILRLLLDLRDERGTSILLITHNIGVISEICDRVCAMYAGQIVEMGDVVDVLKHPLHPYTQGLMGAIHHIGEKRDPEEIPGNVPNLMNPPSGCRFHPRCSRVLDICDKKKPEPIEVHPGHSVACWLYEEE